MLHAGDVIVLAIGEWPPYTSASLNKKDKIAEMIVKEAFNLEGVEVKYEYFPWKRAYVSVLRGDYAGTFPWIKTKEREQQFFLSKEPILKNKEVFFHLKSLDFDWNTFDDLKKYSIGGTLGYYQAEFLESKGLKIEFVTREELNFKKLLKKRIDTSTSTLIVGYNIINKLFPPQVSHLFTHHPKPLLTYSMHMLISKKNPNGKKLIEVFDRGLKRLKSTGRYSEILKLILPN